MKRFLIPVRLKIFYSTIKQIKTAAVILIKVSEATYTSSPSGQRHHRDSLSPLEEPGITGYDGLNHYANFSRCHATQHL